MPACEKRVRGGKRSNFTLLNAQVVIYANERQGLVLRTDGHRPDIDVHRPPRCRMSTALEKKVEGDTAESSDSWAEIN